MSGKLPASSATLPVAMTTHVPVGVAANLNVEVIPACAAACLACAPAITPPGRPYPFPAAEPCSPAQTVPSCGSSLTVCRPIPASPSIASPLRGHSRVGRLRCTVADDGRARRGPAVARWVGAGRGGVGPGFDAERVEPWVAPRARAGPAAVRVPGATSASLDDGSASPSERVMIQRVACGRVRRRVAEGGGENGRYAEMLGVSVP